MPGSGALSVRVARSGHQAFKVGRGEFPSAGPGGLVVTTLEGDQPVFDLVKAGEVVGREDLALHDGKEDHHILYRNLFYIDGFFSLIPSQRNPVSQAG